MPARHHSRATRLAATFLARLASPEVAAATFKVDVRTVRGWKAGGDVPEDTWTAVRDVLLTRGAEMAAKGDVKGLVQTLTAAGISERNVRYGELLRQREARRAGEQEQEETEPVAPWRTAIHELSDSRQRLLRDRILLELNSADREAARVARLEGSEPAPEPRSQEESDAAFLEFVEWLAAMSDEQVEAETERVKALREEEIEKLAAMSVQYASQATDAEQARTAQRQPEPVPPVADTPTAAPVSPQPPKPALRAVDDGDPSQWQPFRRWEL